MPIIRGTGGDDILRDTAQSDQVWGLNGLDTFRWSGRGNDVFYAGTGGERYNANPYTPGNPGGDRLVLEGSVGARMAMSSTENGFAIIGNQRLNFTGVERIFGTSGDDHFYGGAATLNAAGNGKQGHGLSVFTGAGNDNIHGSRFDDVIDGGSGNDTINGAGGNDFIHSNTGNDLIYGGAGNDNIRWGNGDANHNPGHDTINGGAGDDLINIWIKRGDISSQNEAVGIPGVGVTIDIIHANGSFAGHAQTNIGGNASLVFRNFEIGWTHSGNDVLDASGASVAANRAGVNFNTRWGNDHLIGSRGNDTLDGSMGRDTVAGGQGNDDIWIGDANRGDGNRDVLIFRAGDGADTVHGFETGLDVLNMAGRSYSAVEVNNGTMLNLGGGDSVLLHGVFDFI